jgi:uncharacterized protein (TIGR03435 family)
MRPAKKSKPTLCLLAVLTAMPVATAQGAAAAPGQDQPTRLTFDVAVIRPGEDKGGGHLMPTAGGNGYSALNFPVRQMIALMYWIPLHQVTGGPDWIDTAPYDIEAKADHPYSLDDLHTMFQNLLADRFHLKFHIEQREGPVYALTIDKSGLKMRPNQTPQDYKVPIVPNGFGVYAGTRVSMRYLTWFLSQQLRSEGRPVVDRTGLTGNYDFTLSFLPELPPNTSPENLAPELRDRPSLVDAVREELGLTLQRDKGPVPYLVIDQIDRPSDN